jgi:tetratricopeptide (TPR) repeat protein
MHHLRWIEITMAALAVICASAASTAAVNRYAAVEEALERGYRDEAGSRLNDILEDDFIDAQGLYYFSRLEQKGELSVEHLQKSLRLCDDQCGSVPSELADAYYAWGRYQDAVALYKEYRKRIEKTRENMKFFWFAGMSFIKLGEYSAAEKAFKEIEKEFDGVQLSGWGTLGRGSARAERGKTGDAMSSLRPLVRSGGAISALAIYNRAYFAARMGDEDDALFGYNILDQRFGEFLGSAELGELILAERSQQTISAAEELVDITYTIEMGVFGDKSEADKLVGKLKATKWSASLEDTVVGDRKYWVVTVGIFRSRQSAQETREKLEGLYPGSYRVVIR